MTFINKYSNYLFDTLFLFVLVFTVFNFKIVNLPMALLILLSFIFFKKIKKENISMIQIIFGIFVLYVILNGFLQSNFSEKRYELLLLTFLATFVAQFTSHKIILLRTFIISCLLIVFYGLVSLGLYYFKSKDFIFTVGDHINELLYLERPYLGFLVLIAASVSLYLYENEQKRFWKKFALTSLPIFIAYLFVISARMAIISFVFLVTIFFFVYLKLQLTKKLFIALICFISILSVFTLNKSLYERFSILVTKQENIELIKDKDPRMIIWPCATEILKEPDFNLLFGLSSTHQLTQKLVNCYSLDTVNLDRRNYFMTSKFNSHNQYLDLLLTNGIIGLILFLLFICIAIFKNIKTFPILAMWIIFAFFCITENIFYRQIGFYFLILIFFFSDWMKPNKIVNTN